MEKKKSSQQVRQPLGSHKLGNHWYLANSSEWLAETHSHSFHEPIKCQCCPHIETSQLICWANQLTGFYKRTTLALNGLKMKDFLNNLADISLSLILLPYPQGRNSSKSISYYP